MSDTTEQSIDASCTGCKADLTKTGHKDDCPILANQKAEQDARDAQQEKLLADNLAMEAAEKAKKELEKIHEKTISDLKEEMKNAKTETEQMRLKNIILDRIQKLAPEEKFDRNDFLKKFTLNDLSEIYKNLLSLVKEDRKRKYKATCPICAQKLGVFDNYDQAKQIVSNHKKTTHPTNYGNLVIATILLSLTIAGSVAAFKIYKKRQKKADSGDAQ